MSFKKVRRNPIELIEQWWPHADHSHIDYDQSMKFRDSEYYRIGQYAGDGTIAFTIEMLQKLLAPFLNKTTCYKPTFINHDGIKNILYRIGDIRHSTVYGIVELGCGKCEGLRERVRIPVICQYIYK